MSSSVTPPTAWSWEVEPSGRHGSPVVLDSGVSCCQYAVETYGPVASDQLCIGKSVVMEIVAAVVGAVIGIAGVTASGMGSRNRENREEAVRLTVAVESIAERLDSLHIDMKADRSAIYKLLNEQGNRITALEARPNR